LKKFVNIYIILFLLDGLVSLINTLTGRLWGIQPLFMLQGTIALMVVVLSIPVYILIGSMRAFPKRVVLPMVIFTIWGGLFFALPMPIYLGIGNTILILSLIQPCLAIVTIVVLRYSMKHGYWLYNSSDFTRSAFQWKRLFGFAAANVILIIPLIGVWLAVSLSLAISHLSSGFIHLGVRGMSVEARTYVYEDKQILLLPTVHIAQPAFYKRLVEPLSVESTVVIPEGVTDKQKLLKEPLDYSKIARRAGLEMQDNQVIVAERNTALCDVDINEFSPGTIDYLRTCAAISRHWSSGKRMLALQAYASASQPDLDLLWKDLLDMRNQRVTACITDCLQTYDTIVIPWGAAHMPGIQRAILKWGATMTEHRRVPVWDFSSHEQEASQESDAGDPM
jgi:hypothetical protein